MAHTEDYIVRIEQFEGPLDLLLYLIRKNEVEIEDVPIAAITDQYLAHLHDIERIDVDLAAEFLVMAATLMEIKSRLIGGVEHTLSGAAARAAAGSGEEEGDPREELIAQLLAYKRYRDAADELERRRTVWERRFPSGKAGVDRQAIREAVLEEQAEVEMDDLDLYELVKAFAKIVESVNFDVAKRGGAHEVVADDTPIELHAEDLLDRLRRAGRDERGNLPKVGLRESMENRTRPEMIGLFLALLELIKCGVVTIRPIEDAWDVEIELKPEILDEPELYEAPAFELLTRAVNEQGDAAAGDQGEQG